MALGVEGIRIGVWTHDRGHTGCTVVLAPEGTLGAVAVRGASPGTREAMALGPDGKLLVCNAVVLSGGSAYGLAVADGVMLWLEERGIGYEVADAIVPIVGAAIVLDRSVATPDARPDAAAGRAACDAATEDDPPEGAVGAGAGCSVAKVAGLEHRWRGGQGVAVRRHGDLVVGAVVANNAVGEIVADDGTWVARARVPDDHPRYPMIDEFPPMPAENPGRSAQDPPTHSPPGPVENTVIGCVVTNARLDKISAYRVADLAHGGIVRAVRPAHTNFDGDALFCLATGQVDATIDQVAHLAADAVAEACRRGPLAAHGTDEIPGLADDGLATAADDEPADA